MSFRPAETQYVALKFMIFLPQPPECWDYRFMPPHLALFLFFNELMNKKNHLE
jgi:hypothetical protein